MLECSHCGNVARQEQLFQHSCGMLYDQIPNGEETEDLHEVFHWYAYCCTTCSALNLYGGFSMENHPNSDFPRLYPEGANLLPDLHKLSAGDPIPPRITRIYAEVYPLRKRSPNAFVVQIRRALEFICQDKGATGRDLFSKLQDLVTQGVFPGYLEEMTDLLRRIGNIGAHADQGDADIWDAELIDDFFRAIVDYVYVSPSKIERLKKRLERQKKND